MDLSRRHFLRFATAASLGYAGLRSSLAEDLGKWGRASGLARGAEGHVGLVELGGEPDECLVVGRRDHDGPVVLVDHGELAVAPPGELPPTRADFAVIGAIDAVDRVHIDPASGCFLADGADGDLVVLVVALVLLAMLWRAEGGLRSPWVVYSLVVLAVPLSSGTLTSMARFSLMAFPLLWPLADWLGRDRRRVHAGLAVAVVGIVLAVLQLLMRSP